MSPEAARQAWTAVDRRLAETTEHHRVARTPAEFGRIGRECAEILFLLLYALYGFDRERAGKMRLSMSIRDLLADYTPEGPGDGRSTTVVRGCLEDAEICIDSGTEDHLRAALCLTATTTAVQYLAIAAGRRQSRETVKDLCEWFLANTPGVGASQTYTIQKLGTSMLGRIVASEISAQDVADHANSRQRDGISGATVGQDLTYLRGVFVAAKEKLQLDISTLPIDAAKESLRKTGYLGQSPARQRRITGHELQALVNYFDQAQDRPHPSKIPVRDIIEFALWSARRISEICEIRWADLDVQNRTCLVKVTDARRNVRIHKFPLLGKALDIVMRQPRTTDKIFPYRAKTVSKMYTDAKKKLGIEDLRFQDLRRESAIRLHEAGHSLEQIALVTGRKDLNTLRKDIGVLPQSAPKIGDAD